MAKTLKRLDELSKSLVGRYIKKASLQNYRGGVRMGKSDDDNYASSAKVTKTKKKHDLGTPYDSFYTRTDPTSKRRMKGTSQAVNKLTGQARVPATEETLDELQKSTLRSYIHKASKSLPHDAVVAHHNKEKAHHSARNFSMQPDINKQLRATAKADAAAYKRSDAKVRSRVEGINRAAGKLDEFDIGMAHEITHHIGRHAPELATFGASVVAARAVEHGAERAAHHLRHHAKKLANHIRKFHAARKAKKMSPMAKLHAHADKIASEETLQEVGKERLLNYMKKNDYAKQSLAKNHRKAFNRLQGSRRAFDRLQPNYSKDYPNEETINELSDKVVRNYEGKARTDRKGKTGKRFWKRTVGISRARQRLGED